MGSLAVNELLDDFWSNYPAQPSEHERKSLTAWGVGLQDDELLKKVLDTDKHPQQSNGAIPKPSLATLKGLVSEIKANRGDYNRQADKYLIDEEECFYCSYGQVSIVDWRARDWYSVIAGRCKHCRNGERGSNAFKPIEPQERIIELAREWGMICHEAVDRVIENRENMLKEKPNTDKEIPF